MRFFDTIRSSFDFGKGRTDAIYYTQDLGSKMGFYWISPNGQLYFHDDDACWKEQRLYPGHPEYNHEFPWKNKSYKLSGCRGRMRMFTGNGSLSLYDESHHWAVWVEIKRGCVVNYDA